MAKRILSLEELEVNNYIQQQEDAKKSSEYDLLYHQEKVDQEIDEEESDVNTEIDQEDDTANNTTDSTSDTLNPDDSVSIEGYYIEEGITFVKDSLRSLASIGLHYTPIVLSKVYKGTLFGVVKLIKGLISSYDTILNYYTDHVHTFQSLQDDIAKLRKTVELIEVSTDDKSELVYTKAKIINALKISDSIDIKSNIDVLKLFLSDAVHSISKSIDKDIGYIKHMVSMVTSRSIKDPHVSLESIPLKQYLTAKSLPSFDNSDLVSTYQSDVVLPGDIRMVAMLPSVTGNNIDNYIRSYNQSSLILWLDSTSFKDIDNIAYLDKEGALALLDALNELCNEAIKHVAFYEQIQKDQKSLKYLFRIYISSLFASDDKLKSSVSLIDFINLKSMFIQRIYLPFSIDLHRYTVKVIQSGISYCEDSVKQL